MTQNDAVLIGCCSAVLKWFSRANNHQSKTLNIHRTQYYFHSRTHPTPSKEERNKLENPVVFFQQLKPAKFTQRTSARVFIMGVKRFSKMTLPYPKTSKIFEDSANISWPQSRISFAKRSTVTSIFSCKLENLDVFAVYMNVFILACISPSFHILHVHQLITITAEILARSLAYFHCR